ncbi:MAG TPA: LamG-like jellyroll fold domain-containing protein, partial [Cyclobacteriaceae bacterium]|nr:LamG-like jellyroll fold domain-containing protein [Cyclobacteriaceae bacterium]
GWNHWAVVLDNATSTMTLYKNGAALATASGSVTLTPQNLEASTANYFGRSQYGADHYIDAVFDEFRISNTARSAEWIQASYNNQNTPTSFYTLGTEQAATALCAPLPITLSLFDATLEMNKVKISWTTASEINNEYFTIERSVDGVTWTEIAMVPGAGNSDEELSYVHWDNQPIPGTSYYRLKQTDFDGTSSYSKIDAVVFSTGSEVRVYARPENHELIVELGDLQQGGDISVLNILGQPLSIPFTDDSAKRVYNTLELSSGVYIVRVRSHNGIVAEKVVIK